MADEVFCDTEALHDALEHGSSGDDEDVTFAVFGDWRESESAGHSRLQRGPVKSPRGNNSCRRAITLGT